MNPPVDFTKLFNTIGSIVCALVECIDGANAQLFISVGYVGNQIVLKLNDEEDTPIYRFEMTSPREAKEKMAWIIEERGLIVRIVYYYCDGNRANITADFYRGNKKTYTFDAHSRSHNPIKFSYNLFIPDVDTQELYDNYNGFLMLLSQNKLGLGIIEASPNPIKLLRKAKLQTLLLE